MKNIRIFYKFLLLAGILIGILIILGVVSFNNLSFQNELIQNIVHDKFKQVRIVSNISKELLGYHNEITRILRWEKLGYQSEEKGQQNIPVIMDKIDLIKSDKISSLHLLKDQDKQEILSLLKDYKEWIRNINSVIKVDEELAVIYLGSADNTIRSLIYILAQFESQAEKESNEAFNSSEKRFSITIVSFLVIFLISVILAVIVSYIIGKSIIKNINKLIQALSYITETRDLSKKVEVDTKDELKDLADYFNHFIEELRHYSQGLESMVEERTVELKDANEKLKELDQVKTDFLSTVSHELRTPLTSILGFTKIIQKKLLENVLPKTPLDDKKTSRAVTQIESNLKIITYEGERLTHLINDVLDIAKMEAGKIEWNFASVSFNKVVEHAIQSTSSLFENKSVQFITKLDSSNPKVYADKDRIIQVIINLISNAVKFTQEGAIICETRVVDNQVEFMLSDSGEGIAEEDLLSIFEKFKQVGDTLTDRPKGTGLGLPICKQIIEHHGGIIYATSIIGKGSQFIFRLKMLDEVGEGSSESLEKLVKQLKDRMTISSTIKNTKTKILVVDDDSNIRELIRQELEEEGFLIIEAADGVEAIAKAKEKKPDLIILDVMMPKIDGYDTAAVLKNDSQTSKIPIIILSILEDRERGYRLGIDSYLHKPLAPDILIREIDSLINRKSSNKTLLVVEKENYNFNFLKHTLKDFNLQIEIAKDPNESIEKAKEIKPDMIVIDEGFANEFEYISQLRYESGLENVYFILLGKDLEK